MNPDKPQIKKLYYSISEVSKITGLKQYVLRYWETEFPLLKPNKNRAGNRNYRDTDIQLIQEIKTLLYEKKFTIKGARQYLKDRNKSIADTPDKVVKIADSMPDLKTLKDLRNGLGELIKTIESFKKEV